MSTLLTVCRIRRSNFRREWLHTVSPRVWTEQERLAVRFLSAKPAREVRAQLLTELCRYRWRVVVRPLNKEDQIQKPLLYAVNWRQTNRSLSVLYNVSESTIANWRQRAGRPPAPRGGVRPGAGRKPGT